MRTLFVALAGALLASLPVHAQTPTATLVGRITDATHASIAGATVRVRNLETNELRTVDSQIDGEFTVADLRPGTYELTAEKQGFKQVLERSLELQVGQTARQDLALEVGSTTQSVEVTAVAAAVNAENATRGDVIAPNEIAEMPLNGRDFNDLAFLVAGVQPAEQSAKGSPYVVNGARADSSNVTIDGLNDFNPRDAGAQARPPLDSLQEFKLQTSGFSAEYGRLAGGVVTMALKSGGNQLHGSVFEFVRNDLFDARSFFDAGKAELRRNQFGATVTGPLTLPKLYHGQDRTFFLVSWESERQVSGSSNLGVVPSLLERNGDFSQSFDATGKLIPLKDPLAGGSCTATVTTGCFPGNKIPASRISSAALQSMAYYPLPNLVGANNERSYGVSADSWDNFLFKVDQRIGQKDTFAVRAMQRWETSGNPFSGSTTGTFPSTTNTGQELLGISETRLFTAGLINEFRAGVTRTTDDEASQFAGTNWAAKFGIPGTTNDPNFEGFPKFSITGFEGLGDSTSNPIHYVVNNWNVNDGLTWIKGRHAIRIGAEVLRVQYYQPTNSNFNGTFTFNGKVTGDGFGDFLLGFPSSTSRKIGTVTNHIFSVNYAGYIQDDFKVLPRLTLNLGVRYELQMPAYEQAGQMTNFIPSLDKVVLAGTATIPNVAASLAAAGLSNYVTTRDAVGLPQALVYPNYDNFAPRFGLAWRPFGDNRTVVRGGYGIFYTGSRLSAMRTDLTGGFPYALSQSFTGSTTNPNLSLASPFPDALAKLSGTTTTNGWETNAPSPYLESWNFTVEREVGNGVVIEGSYTGSKGTHLGRKYDVNQEIRTPAYTIRPYGGYGDIEYYTFGQNSSYNAGTITVRKRISHGLFFRANYTYGKSIDTNSGLNYAGAGGYQGAQDSTDLKAERGLSDFDARHVFSMNFAYLLPFRRFALVRGWQLAGSGTARSGQPFTPQYSGPSNDVAQATRPDRLINGSLPNPSPNMWFNLNAFLQVPDSAYRYGNSGRNILEGPGSAAINFALSKQFRLGERFKAQFRWETFNVLNRANFQQPSDTLDKANAGTITSAGAGRQMQLGLRCSF
jgi:Carboxypeptidase regulatory-like domain/TonB dependent receptor